jgi:hypothetical protein
MRKFLVALSLLIPVTLLHAQAVDPSPKAEKTDVAPAAKTGNGTDSFWAQFGVGLSVSAKLGGERSIDEAQLVNGIVRVTSERQVTPRLMLERHWYFKDWSADNPHFLQGIYIGASLLGDKKLMDSVSLGWIVAFKPNAGDKSTHNLGVGLAVEPYSRVLGDGIEKNKALPIGETSIRYKETNRTALVLFYTYTMAK